MACAGAFESVSVDVVRPLTGASLLMGKVAFSESPDVSAGLHVTNDADSTSPTTGAITCAGGVGVTKTLWAGGDLSVRSRDADAALALSGDLSVGGYATVAGAASCGSAEACASPATGAAKIGAGGLAALRGAAVGGSLSCASTADAGPGASLSVSGDAAFDASLTVGGSFAASGAVEYRRLTVTHDLAATNAGAAAAFGDLTVGAGGAGALEVSGGLSVAGALALAAGSTGATVDGVVRCADAGAGSLAVTGSASVAGKIVVGSTAALAGDAEAFADAEGLVMLPYNRGGYSSLPCYGYSVFNDPTDFQTYIPVIFPIPPDARPGCPIAVVALCSLAPETPTVTAEVPIDVVARWTADGAALPDFGLGDPVEADARVVVHVGSDVARHAVLYRGVAPASNVGAHSLWVCLFPTGDPTPAVYVSPFHLLYVRATL